MRLEVIANKGPASLGPELEKALAWAAECHIASAFVTPSALKRIEDALQGASKAGRTLVVKLVFGLYGRFTAPATMKYALAIQKRYPARFFVRVASEDRFHWKLYLFSKGGTARCYLGSANLTEDGLTASGELSLKATASASESVAVSLNRCFKGLWESDSFLLSKHVYSIYRKMARPDILAHHRGGDNPLRKFLKKVKRNRANSPAMDKLARPESIRPRSVYLNLKLSDETVRIVNENTNWDDKEWWYFADSDKGPHEKARDAGVLLVVEPDSQGKELMLQFCHVMDTVELVTDEGKYFTAYKPVRGGRCCRYTKHRSLLRQVGLTQTALKSDCRRLTAREAATLYELLRVNPKAFGATLKASHVRR